jgi:hypothetical protein
VNVFLWVLQILLAIHTGAGAMWKLSNSEQTVPSLSALPHGAWLALMVFELLCILGLLLPAVRKRMAIAAPLAAVGIAAEMLLFCGVHLASGDRNSSPMLYWLVVAAVCAIVAYGRFVARPFHK